MQAGCPHCGHVQTVGEVDLAGGEMVEIACTACGKPFQVENPRLQNLQAETTRKSAPPVRSETSQDGRPLRLPEGKSVGLRVLEGEGKGTVYPVLKPRVTLGRSNADILVNDALSSRLHCVLEFGEDAVILRDLGSTNGTLVDNHPVRFAEIADGSTFQIGKHIFQLRIASEKS